MCYRDFLIRLLTITLLAILLIGAWTLRSILMLGFLAVILAVTLHIPAAWLERRGLTHPVATTISVIGFAILATLLTIWMLPSMIIDLANLVAIVPGAMSELGDLDICSKNRFRRSRFTCFLRFSGFIQSIEVSLAGFSIAYTGG